MRYSKKYSCQHFQKSKLDKARKISYNLIVKNGDDNILTNTLKMESENYATTILKLSIIF